MMKEKVLAIIERETGKKVTPETTIEKLDIESLEFLDLLLVIQEETGIEIPDATVAKINSIGDLVKAVEGTLITQ